MSGGKHSSSGWSLTGDSSYKKSCSTNWQSTVVAGSVCTPVVTSCVAVFLTEFVASLLRLLLVVLLLRLSMPVLRRFNSTTMGSGAVRNTWTASSWGKLLTSIPFTWNETKTQFNFTFPAGTYAMRHLDKKVNFIKSSMGHCTSMAESLSVKFYRISVCFRPRQTAGHQCGERLCDERRKFSNMPKGIGIDYYIWTLAETLVSTRGCLTQVEKKGAWPLKPA